MSVNASPAAHAGARNDAPMTDAVHEPAASQKMQPSHADQKTMYRMRISSRIVSFRHSLHAMIFHSLWQHPKKNCEYFF